MEDLRWGRRDILFTVEEKEAISQMREERIASAENSQSAYSVVIKLVNQYTLFVGYNGSSLDPKQLSRVIQGQLRKGAAIMSGAEPIRIVSYDDDKKHRQLRLYVEGLPGVIGAAISHSLKRDRLQGFLFGGHITERPASPPNYAFG